MRPPLKPLLLVVILSTSGCAGVFGPDRPPSDQRAVDALNRSQAAMAEVDSYRADVDGRVEATGDGEQVTVDMTGAATVNVSAQRMNATGQLEDGETTVSPMTDTTQVTYLSGYTASVECSRIGWARQNLSEAHPWLAYTPLGQQLALLNRTAVYWRGTETVNGTEAAVIVAHPTKTELRSGPDIQGQRTAAFENANIANATVTLWIATETDRPLKARRDIRIRQNGNTARATVTFRFTNYDEPAPVERPEFDGAAWETGCPAWD